jgi:predicted membrane metal-binding protein
MTTEVYLILYLNLLKPFGGHTRLIGSPLITIISWLYFIPDLGMCIPLALMPLQLIGMALMACLYHLYF